MAILMPNDTTGVLGLDAGKCESRSLLLDKFCDPSAEKDDRKKVFTRAFRQAPSPIKSNAWTTLLRNLSQVRNTAILHAQLQSRLMVNMAGGVMENAGLCLDRFGMPYIPGSAVKGCARRAALAALHEWCHGDDSSPMKPIAPDNLFSAACAPFQSPEEMLAALARVFGWCEQDWNESSDFAWACGESGSATKMASAQSLAKTMGWQIHANDAAAPWRSLPNYAGSIAFLPAYPLALNTPSPVKGLPVKVPELGDLELDVVTCHHRGYYASDNPQAIATDTEDPVPVFFPAVVPGHLFTFALLSLRSTASKDLQAAVEWLSVGLNAFGIGAKTNAGYGWFRNATEVSKGVWVLNDRTISPPSQIPAASQKPNPSSGDFDNETIFRNTVIKRLDRPGEYALLRDEIVKLHKPENAKWVARLKEHLASPDGKGARKLLSSKDWFPQEWFAK